MFLKTLQEEFTLMSPFCIFRLILSIKQSAVFISQQWTSHYKCNKIPETSNHGMEIINQWPKARYLHIDLTIINKLPKRHGNEVQKHDTEDFDLPMGSFNWADEK